MVRDPRGQLASLDRVSDRKLWIETTRSDRRQRGRADRHARVGERDCAEDPWVTRRHAVEHARKQFREPQCGEDARDDAGHSQPGGTSNDVYQQSEADLEHVGAALCATSGGCDDDPGGGGDDGGWPDDGGSDEPWTGDDPYDGGGGGGGGDGGGGDDGEVCMQSMAEGDMPDGEGDCIDPVTRPEGISEEDWTNMNLKEKWMCVTHLDECALFTLVANEAINWAVDLAGDEGATDNIYDAMRHAYWQAMMTRDLGPGRAEAWGDAHEWGSDSPGRTCMDQYNNVVGREIAIEAGEWTSWATLRQLVRDAADQNRLQDRPGC